MTVVKSPMSLVAVFLWAGFVCAISFMEAWLKFRAPGITLPLGLGIGRLVFNALNKAEWVFAIVIIASLFSNRTNLLKQEKLLFLIPLLILIVQSVWLLPMLDLRAELHIKGASVPPSNLHFYYIGLELAKVVCLMLFGITRFEKTVI